MTSIVLCGENLTAEQVVSVARDGIKVTISGNSYKKMAASRGVVDTCVAQHKIVYGLTTGFGKFADVEIAPENITKLQKNLIMSHACGVGEPFDTTVVRAMILLRINALAVGYSGISKNTIDTLLSVLNSKVVPYVPSKGSLGASGDLVPLAHIALCLIGEGNAYYDGALMTAKEALSKAKISPIELTSKEGLALINGTQGMCALACICICGGEMLNKTADCIACLSLEAHRAVADAFDERIHKLRNQTGQIKTAENLRRITNGSTYLTRQGEIKVQDAYTLRCIPQIHGPSKDAFAYVSDVVNKEINAVTDNPVIFPETEEAISGGNFHGQCLALALDFLAISFSELSNVSERRIERSVNTHLSHLPPFLVAQGGLNSGLMIPQYVAASLVNENKVLCTPASVDSITSSASQEDHVSMGMTSARKCRTVMNNLAKVLAIELLVSCQAIDFAGDFVLGAGTQAAYDLVRKHVPFMQTDRIIAPDIEKCTELIEDGSILSAVENAVGKLN